MQREMTYEGYRKTMNENLYEGGETLYVADFPAQFVESNLKQLFKQFQVTLCS
jgi:hypothetical protein